MRSKLTSFFDVQIVACDVVIKQFLQANLTLTTLYATIAWLENGVSLRVVCTSDINTSKSGKTKFSEIVNNISIRRSMGRKNTLITGQTLEEPNELVYFSCDGDRVKCVRFPVFVFILVLLRLHLTCACVHVAGRNKS